MKTLLFSAGIVLLSVAPGGCTTYRHIEHPDGTRKTIITLAPGTSVTGPGGLCIDSRGKACVQQPVMSSAK